MIRAPSTAGSPGAKCNVVIVHGVLDSSRPDEQDTLLQAAEVAEALEHLGYGTEALALSLDLSPLARLANPDILVFNLVEGLDGNGRLQHLPPAVMEHLGVAFTGASAAALAITTDKVLAKTLLAAAGLPVPETVGTTGPADASARYIVKSLTEDASFGIDDASVVAGTEVASEIVRRAARFGGDWFAERYVEGREFNISVFTDETGGPRVLPAAEIVFVGYGEGRPRIVDYAAKRGPEGHGDHNTPPPFGPRQDEPELVAELDRLTRAAWHTLGLAGYARVDFRVDERGRCYILEVNANPCLSSDAGFMAAAAEAGLSFDDVIARIVEASLRRNRKLPAPSPS